ncbi:hypothetical protein JHL21_09560 [Devosia sp. WQ 349]|jgi:hypothetical protein|uniref:hypothetical protein n=1 Tax=Devosia sp. WQ 349K1 TaxID=2800329 RepID=UPI00190379E8|nr:hypothetical protein [Devosia sp. WQ 349K1]MBK1794748.1 hypothetical protein [Devosia sp. WQ 349K1]
MTSEQTELDTQFGVLITLMTELTALLDRENRALEAGLRTSLAFAAERTHERKAELSAELETWVSQVRSGQINLGLASPDVREQVTASSEALDAVVKENMERLKAGIETTRTRVEAIMSAIREQATSEGAYDATGRRARISDAPSSLLV